MTDTTSRRTRPGGQTDDGPRGTIRQLLPYLADHRPVLIAVVALSLAGAAASLAQPVLVSQVIGIVEKGDPLGSLVWLLMALHTTHLVTDTWDTTVLDVLFFTGPLEGKRYVDVSENALYWYFVVISWLPIYAVVYLAPRG